MALFDYIPKPNKFFLNEGNFVVNEFNAGNNSQDDDDDDIQGLDDSEVDDEGNDDNPEADATETPDPQTDNTPTEPADDTTTDNDVDTQDDDELEGIDDSEVDDGTNDGENTDNQDTPTDDSLDSGDGGMDDNGGDDELDTIDDDSDGMDGTGEGTDDPSADGVDSGDGLEGEDSLDSPENDPHQRLKELENEIFDQLSEPEKQMKINELKKLYGVLIDKADSLYKLTQEISKTDDTVRMIDYTLNTLLDLKTYLKDYVIDVYENRTYLQNSVNFQKFLTIFDAIHAIFKEIKKQLELDDKK